MGGHPSNFGSILATVGLGVDDFIYRIIALFVSGVPGMNAKSHVSWIWCTSMAMTQANYCYSYPPCALDYFAWSLPYEWSTNMVAGWPVVFTRFWMRDARLLSDLGGMSRMKCRHERFERAADGYWAIKFD